MRRDGNVWTILCAGALAAGLVGCSPTTAFNCGEDHTCESNGGTGRCEPTGFCSFEDSSCDGGYRYGDLAGDLAGECVDDDNTPPPPPVDTDGDGVDDVDDNCDQIQNPAQFNEDNDTLGDDCDPCPIDPNNLDGDRDLVGDICDPNPNAAGDRLVAFEGFHRGVPPAPWVTQGAWTAIGDAVTTTAADAAQSLLTLPVDAGKTTVTTSATVMKKNSLDFTLVGVVENHTPPNTNSAIGCGVADTMAFGNAQILSYLVRNAPATVSNSSYEMSLDTAYRIELRRNDTVYACKASRGAISAAAPERTGTPSAAHNAGLLVHAADARYEWVMIVASP